MDPILLHATDLSQPITTINQCNGIGGVGVLQVYPSENIEQDYLQQQQRSLWLAPIDLSTQQKLNLLLHLHELVERQMAYRYLDYNCATALVDLLQVVYTPLQAPYQQWQQKVWQTPLEFVQGIYAQGVLADFTLMPTQVQAATLPLQQALPQQIERAGQTQNFKQGENFLTKFKSSQWTLAAALRQQHQRINEDTTIDTGFNLSYTLAGSPLTDNHWQDFAEYRLALLQLHGSLWFTDELTAEIDYLTLYVLIIAP